MATLKLLVRYKKVTYYSVCLDDDGKSEFEKFRETYDGHEKFRKHYLTITKWLQTIGTKVGAHEKYFRPEKKGGDASGLPPSFILGCKLRLYCMVLNENVVIIFNGANKTANKAQDCPNVYPHFRMANKLAEAIDKAIIAREIRWNKNCTDILYDTDLDIEL